MGTFNFTCNKTKSFISISRFLTDKQNTATLIDFIKSDDIYECIDKDNPENIDKLTILKVLLESKPNTGIVNIRYLKEAGRIIFAVGECFDSIKTLTDILNLPQGPENYLERVKLRREYIDLKLKENPSEKLVFWDYPDYFGGSVDRVGGAHHKVQTIYDYKINTNGVIISSFNNVIGVFRVGNDAEGRRKNYIDVGCDIVNVSGDVTRRTIRRSRLVACTFVPMNETIKSDFIKNDTVNIVPDHLDMDKQNDVYTNLEWVYKETNTIRGLIKNGMIKYYLIEIMKGDRKGEKFYVHGIKELNAAGLPKDITVVPQLNNVTIGVKCQIVNETEATKYPHGINDPSYFDQFKRIGFVGTNKQTQYYYRPLSGPFIGQQFKITGRSLENVFIRKRFRIQRLSTVNLGGVWEFKQGLDSAIDDYPNELVSWIKENRESLLKNDILLAKYSINNPNVPFTIDIISNLFNTQKERQEVMEHIKKQTTNYNGNRYKIITLSEARELGFKY